MKDVNVLKEVFVISSSVLDLCLRMKTVSGIKVTSIGVNLLKEAK